MHEQLFKRYAAEAKIIGGDYAAGYMMGLRRHYHGDRFELPAPVETLLDAQRFGERAAGFADGLAGRAPVLPGKMGVVHFDVPQRQKSAWVRAAQRADSKLIPWIMARLDEAAQATDTEKRNG